MSKVVDEAKRRQRNVQNRNTSAEAGARFSDLHRSESLFDDRVVDRDDDEINRSIPISSTVDRRRVCRRLTASRHRPSLRQLGVVLSVRLHRRRVAASATYRTHRAPLRICLRSEVGSVR